MLLEAENALTSSLVTATIVAHTKAMDEFAALGQRYAI